MKFTIQVLLLLLSVLFLSGCGGLAPFPDKPEDYFTITVNSIPSGANVYEVEATNGSLGRLLGETPYDLSVGIAPRRWSNGKLALMHGGTEFGAVVDWSPYRRVSGSVEWDLLLNVAIVKDGYYTKMVKNRNVYTLGPRHRYPPHNTTVTALLRQKKDSPSRAPQQQQQQQQQQTVVIPKAETTPRGMIMVTSTPEYAEIYADGAFIGNTPASLKLSEGIHIIELKMGGFKLYRKALRVIGSSELNLRVTLEKE